MKNALIDTVLELVSISGPSRQERDVANYLRAQFEALGYRVEEDDCARMTGGNCGNLFCYPPTFDSSRPAMLLVAHMDTVSPTEQAIPKVENGILRSENDKALGLDNRVGIAILLQAARSLAAASEVACNVIFLFTVCEEIGSLGARHLEIPPNACFGYVFDSSARPGSFIASTFGARVWELRINGKSAHAGVEPEKGVNAIQAAAHILSRIALGRISKDHTANVGLIQGGSAVNVVPDSVTISGETRASYEEILDRYIETLEEISREVVSAAGGTYALRQEVAFQSYSIDKNSHPYRLLHQVLTDLRLPVNPLHYSGGSDANPLNARGLPTINVGIGAQHPHSADEFILVDDLESSYNIVLKLLQYFAANGVEEEKYYNMKRAPL